MLLWGAKLGNSELGWILNSHSLALESVFLMAPLNCWGSSWSITVNPEPQTKKVRTIGSPCSVWFGQQMWVLEQLQHLIVSREARLSSRPIHGSGRGEGAQRVSVSSGCCLKLVEGNQLYFKGWFQLGFWKHPDIWFTKNYIHGFFLSFF